MDLRDRKRARYRRSTGCLAHDLSGLPSGYDTMIGDVHAMSGGQARIAIARAILKDSPS